MDNEEMTVDELAAIVWGYDDYDPEKIVKKIDLHSAICDRLNVTYGLKNSDYGDSYAKTRSEIPFYTLGKLQDKFNRIKNLMLNYVKEPQVEESLEDSLLDLANYAIMEVMERIIERVKKQ